MSPWHDLRVLRLAIQKPRIDWSFRAFGLALAMLGCDQAPSDLREWTPDDHRHTTTPNAGQAAPTPPGAQPNTPAQPGMDEVTIVAWRRSCMRCHGVVGRGDGPEGRMVNAPDLSNPKWQSDTSDEQIANTIRYGKGAMPASELPAGTIQNLVHLVRLFNQAAPGGAAPGGQQPSAPSPSPPPDGSQGSTPSSG